MEEKRVYLISDQRKARMEPFYKKILLLSTIFMVGFKCIFTGKN